MEMQDVWVNLQSEDHTKAVCGSRTKIVSKPLTNCTVQWNRMLIFLSVVKCYPPFEFNKL